MPVWDPLLRLLHWTLVASVVLAWVSTLGFGLVAWHETAGYTALAVVATRVIWGFTGPRFARFAQFVANPSATRHYTASVWAGTEARYLGHNPLGGWMVLLLLGSVAGTAATGWLYTTDAFWGEEWVEQLHGGLAWSVVVLATLHVGGVVFTSLRHAENLVAAMFTGRKRPPARGDEV